MSVLDKNAVMQSVNLAQYPATCRATDTIYLSNNYLKRLQYRYWKLLVFRSFLLILVVFLINKTVEMNPHLMNLEYPLGAIYGKYGPAPQLMFFE